MTDFARPAFNWNINKIVSITRLPVIVLKVIISMVDQKGRIKKD